VTLFIFLRLRVASSSLRSSRVCSKWLLIVFLRDRPEQADVSVVQLLSRPRVLLHVLQDNDMQEIFSQMGGTNFHHVLAVQLSLPGWQGDLSPPQEGFRVHRRSKRIDGKTCGKLKGGVCGKLKGGVCGKQQGLTTARLTSCTASRRSSICSLDTVRTCRLNHSFLNWWEKL
jgi:hypothetical protein